MNKRVADFYFDLFEQGVVPDCYRQITYAGSTSQVPVPGPLNPSDSSPGRAGCYQIKNVPDYLQPQLETGFAGLSYFRTRGYAIHLDGFAEVESYLQQAIKPRMRSSVRSKIRQLESQHNIRYHRFYGRIDRQEYETLMSLLKDMMVRRFQQKEEQNERVAEWDKFHRLFYPLILEKRASLFVIYKDATPIAIALNYHLDRIFFYAIASYDIAYSNYGMGHITIYRQLEWCLAHSYTLYDMSMGDLKYKLDWCNSPYNFTTQLVYLKKSPRAFILARFLGAKLGLKNYLKAKKVHLLYRKLRAFFR